MITIVDYKAGNPTSVKRALASVGIESVISPLAAEVREAERIIFPGVGHAQSTMAVLRERGLDAALKDAFGRGTPILGICVGAQLSLGHSEEGDTTCLGLVPGQVRRFPDMARELKVPHMGWNRIAKKKESPFLEGIASGDYVYFVHSFYVVPEDASVIGTTTDYGGPFVSSVATDRLFACQFHPEKSQELGLRILANFGRFVAAN